MQDIPQNWLAIIGLQSEYVYYRKGKHTKRNGGFYDE